MVSEDLPFVAVFANDLLLDEELSFQVSLMSDQQM